MGVVKLGRVGNSDYIPRIDFPTRVSLFSAGQEERTRILPVYDLVASTLNPSYSV